MAYKDGKVDMKAYGANTNTVSAVLKEDTGKNKLVKKRMKAKKGGKR